MRLLYFITYGLIGLFLFPNLSLFAQSDEIYVIERKEVPTQNFSLQLDQEMPQSRLRNNDCSCIQESVGEVLLCENFQSYEQGPISPQSPLWNLWPGASRDGYVDGNSSGNQFLRLRHQNGTESDVVMDLGNQTSGKYKLSFRLWTWEGYSGYFNVQHDNQLNPANWAYHVQFIDGQGRLIIGSFTQPIAVDTFTYANNTWNYVEQEIDLDQDIATLSINNQQVASWQFSLGSQGPEKQLGAIDFFANEDFNAQFAIDNICLELMEEVDPTPVSANLTCGSRGELSVDRTELTLSLRNVTVRNTGSGPSLPTRLGYYFSTNTSFSEKDFLVATANIPALAPGESTTFNLFIRLKEAPVPNDTYYFGFVIDYENLVEETDESDNNDCYWTSPRFIYKIKPPTEPNLRCAGRGTLTVDGNIIDIRGITVAGDSITGTPASEIGIFLSTDENITNTDYRLGIIAVDSLPPQSSQSFNFNKDLSQLDDLQEGNYTIGIIMDPFNSIDESNEGDNLCYWPETTISLFPKNRTPNLGCFYPGELIINEQVITLSNMIIENNGDSISGAFQVGVYLSDNKNITANDLLVHEFTISNIDDRDALTLSPQIDLSLLDIPAGDYYIGTIIDYKNRVRERNEADNRGCSWVGFDDPLITVTNTVPVDECACTDPYEVSICEDFESYQPGFANYQSTCINSQSGGSNQADEGMITTTKAFSGNQSFLIRENGQANALFLLGERSIGQYELEWVMHIPSGKTAFVTLQDKHQLGIPKLEIGFDGSGSGQILNHATPFNYPSNQWFRVRFLVNMDFNHISVYINDRMVDRQIPFFFRLGSVHFGALDGRSNYYIDDLHYDPISNTPSGRNTPNQIHSTRVPARAVFQVFPNPTDDLLHVELGQLYDQVQNIRLINELGQAVWQQTSDQIDAPKFSIEAKNLEAGLYFLVVQSTSDRKIKKVVVQ